MNTSVQPCNQPSLQRQCRIPLCWALLIAFDASLMALAYAQEVDVRPLEAPVQTVDTDLPGPMDIAADAFTFEAVDVFVDSGNQSLAAWQLELTSRSKGVQIVSIEGGEHPAFSEPAYYDPRAMQNNRVILGAFSTGNDLPTGRSRVARVHVQVRGPGKRLWHTELTTSANADGKRIPAEISIAKAEGV